MSDDLQTIKENCARHSVTIQFMQEQIKEVKEDVKDIKNTLNDFIKCYTPKDEFLYWRNILVSGILLSIFTALVIGLMK